MKSKRFENAISSLVKAFFDGSLGKGNCSACAVGNITGSASWGNVFYTDVTSVQTWFDDDYIQAYGGRERIEKRIFDKCGYSLIELSKVEKAFEANTKFHIASYCNRPKHTIMEDQYNGLMAVVDVLCEIEGYEPAEYKKLFEFQSV